MKLMSLAREYDNITIFRHTGADADAMGSQFGLKEYFKTVFPDKNVLALGNDVGSCAKYFPEIDDADDETIKDSIAFVLDTGNCDRVDDQRFKQADVIIKIDHHPDVDKYAPIQLVDTKASATAQIIVNLLKDDRENINSKCATYLYLGLIADTLSFTTKNTTSDTLEAAGLLVDLGVDVAKVDMMQRGMTLNEFKLINLIRNKVILNDGVAYSIIDKAEYQNLGMEYNQAKEKVYALAHVNEFQIWVLFTEFSDGIYNGSMRSREAIINTIAAKYNGGGHPNASGVKGLTRSDITNLISDLKCLLK